MMFRKYPLMGILDDGEAGGSTETETTTEEKTIDYDGFAKDWGLSEDILGFQAFKNIKTKEDLAKSFVEAQKMVGKKGVFMPTENSSNEEWDTFWAKTGVPLERESYKLDIEREDDLLADIENMAHELRLPPKKASKLVDDMFSKFDARLERMGEDKKKASDDMLDNLRADWGDSFDQRATVAKQALSHFDGDGKFKEYLKESGLGNDAKLIEYFYKIGKSLNTEDAFVGETTSTFKMSASEAMDEMSRIRGDKSHAFWNSRSADHQRAVDEMLKLQRIANSKK